MTHAYMAGSHWHIPEETYSSRFILLLWLCVIAGCIATIGGIAVQASSITATAKEWRGYDGHVDTISPRNWTTWYCNTTAAVWTKDDGTMITTVEVWRKAILAGTAEESGTDTLANAPPSRHELVLLNDTWQIEVFQGRLIITYGLSVLLLLLAIVSACLYASMMASLWKAEGSMKLAVEAGGEKTHHGELREWEATRRRSRSVSRAPGRW
jgi:hypothetical protein